MYGGSKVTRDEFGPKIGETPISEQQASNMEQGLDAGGYDCGPDNSNRDSIIKTFCMFAAGIVMLTMCSTDNLPTEHTSKSSSPAYEPRPQIQAPPLVQGAYYKAGYGQGAAFINGGDEPLQIKFSRNACIIVTNPSPLWGNDIVEIDIPQPGLNSIRAYTHRNQLVAAPECYARRM